MADAYIGNVKTVIANHWLCSDISPRPTATEADQPCSDMPSRRIQRYSARQTE